MNILGIETSCDETAAAVVQDGRLILHSAVASQIAVHRPFRGIVPELASRAHVERINVVIDQALGSSHVPIHGIAVTNGPGLAGALLIGVTTARMLGWVHDIPVVGMNHLEGHLFAGLVEHPGLKPPFLGLIVSGGHTELVTFKGFGDYQVLGRTRDDAAGEAFDKVANLFKLPYPGGPSIDQMSSHGDPHAINFPRAWMRGNCDFSFSGLKTAVVNYMREHANGDRPNLPDLCASFQEAVVDVLTRKTIEAAKAYRLKTIVVGGGVAANRRLREAFRREARRHQLQVFLPGLAFCTDNAAMIAAGGYYKLKYLAPKKRRELGLGIQADLPVRSWKN